VRAAEFGISPLLVTLSRTAKSAQIEIRNSDARPLRVQIQAMAWSQDTDERDRYVESDSLLYFPKAAEIPAGEARIVRLAAKALPTRIEEAYRLFVEELPVPDEALDHGATKVRILLRVGVAVFVAPLESKASGEIVSLDLQHGVAQLILRNTGNVHFRAEQFSLVGLDRDGKQRFVTNLSDRYFLAGATKRLQSRLPSEHCVHLAALEATVRASRIELKRRVDVAPAECK